jgi:hypothetical protein
MSSHEDSFTRAGRILYRELPEEYRYRDVGPHHDLPDREDYLPDLEAYLHGFGHLLDLIRGTTEQAYADAFAEPVDGGHDIQPWLIPYLAELVGAELLAPDPTQRRQELNNAVLWTKSKGTLRNIDAVGDVVAGTETVSREGWRLTLTCPRPMLPPFSVPQADDDTDPLGHTAMPNGCPDLRRLDRAVQDPTGANPLYRLRTPVRTADGMTIPGGSQVFWKPRAPGGLPCFAGHYDDSSARCPDLRDPALHANLGPHPRRTLIHVRTPDGLFAPGLKVVTLDNPQILNIQGTDRNREIDPRQVLALLGDTGPVPDRLTIQLSADLLIPAGAQVTLRDLLFTGTVESAGNPPRPPQVQVMQAAQLTLERVACEHLSLPGDPQDALERPGLIAEDSLFGKITGAKRFATLVYCTVMGETELARIQASDCLLSTLGPTINTAVKRCCIRYSRFDPPPGKTDCFGKSAPTNTSDRPVFVQRWFRDADEPCVFRLPHYGEPGYGVLDTTAPASITGGAEDEGELGAHHHHFFAAALRALQNKLTHFLPLGQEIALAYDPMLALTPPRLVDTDSD